MKGDPGKPLAPLVAEIRRLYKAAGYKSERAFLLECNLEVDRLRSWGDRETQTADQGALQAMADKLGVPVINFEKLAAGRRIGSLKDKVKQEYDALYETVPPTRRADYVEGVRLVHRLLVSEEPSPDTVKKRGRK